MPNLAKKPHFKKFFKTTVVLYSVYAKVQFLSFSRGNAMISTSTSSSATPFKQWIPAVANHVREPIPFGFSVRFGRRLLSFSYDPYVRRYDVRPVFEFTAGSRPGHLDILFLRRWLLVLSKA